MKRCLSLTLVALACFNGPSLGQTLVDGTSYSGLFSPAANVTVEPHTTPPSGVLLNLSVVLDPDTQATGPLGTYWQATAQGGADGYLTVLGLPVRTNTTGAQVALSNNTLQFNVSNDPATLLGALGVGLSTSLSWSATATFNAPGKVVTLAPNTTYRINFNVLNGRGLLNNTLTLSRSFGVELLNGAGVPVGSSGGGSLINILGLTLIDLDGTTGDLAEAQVDFRTGATVPSGAASLRFTAAAALPVTALNIGSNFATISGIRMAALDPYTVWVEESGIEDESDWDPNADPDRDGRPNIQEFAQDTDPTSGAHGDVYSAIGDPDGSGNETAAFIMTIAVRDEVGTFGAGAGQNSGDIIGASTRVNYRVEGSFELENWNLAVSEVTPNSAFITPSMRTLKPGWRYRSFRVPGETSDTKRAFLRVVYDVNP